MARPALHVRKTVPALVVGRVALRRDRRCASGKPFPRAWWVGLRSGATGVARLENRSRARGG